MEQIKRIFFSTWFLWGLFFVNLVGSIYGFYWYKDQLLSTDWYWLIFVPDSPTASTFFTVILALFLLNKRSPLLEAFASITLFKYGIWAIVMIVWGGMADPRPFIEALNWQHWMLMGSHFGMALQAILYAPFYTYRWKEVGVVALWMICNDFLDYRFDIHPWVSSWLEPYHHQLAIFTWLLSGISLILFLVFAYLPSKDRRYDMPLLREKA